MGTTLFDLPPGLPPETRDGLPHAHIAGGYDRSPLPTRVVLEGDRLELLKDANESGVCGLPWPTEAAGHVLLNTSTLIERPTPFALPTELARGKLNQVRHQLHEWESGGLVVSPELREKVVEAHRHYAAALVELHGPDVWKAGPPALEAALRAAYGLSRTYADQLFTLRDLPLPSRLACGLREVPPPEQREQFLETFNAVRIDFDWRSLEPTQTAYDWKRIDDLIQWANDSHLKISAGPLIDFVPERFPKWLSEWEGDLFSLTSFMCDYVETLISRYGSSIRRWEVSAGSNMARGLKLAEEEVLRLSFRLAESAWQIDAALEVSLGLAQPWGDYLSGDDATYSPFVFADTLLRSGLRFAALDLEWVVGSAPRGGYAREILDMSQSLDMFSLLGQPLEVTLSYPAATGADSLASLQEPGGLGHWPAGLTAQGQADWAALAAAIALCKPQVRAVTWDHWSDATPHRFAHGGLLDAAGAARPALAKLAELRQAYLG